MTYIGLLQRCGRCGPRGNYGMADRTIALVVKAPYDDGLVAILGETDAACRRVWRSTGTRDCVVLHLAMQQELVRCCNSQGKLQNAGFQSQCCLSTMTDQLSLVIISRALCTSAHRDGGCTTQASSQFYNKAHTQLKMVLVVSTVHRLCLVTLHAEDARELTRLNAVASLPTLVRGQAIRGHYRAAGDDLVIHARPCLVLLPAYLGLLPHVPHLRILGELNHAGSA